MYYGMNGLGAGFSASARFTTQGASASSDTAPTSSSTTYSYTGQNVPMLDPSRVSSGTPNTMDPDVPTGVPYTPAVNTSRGAASTAAASQGMQASYAEFIRRLVDKKNQLVACGVPEAHAQELLNQQKEQDLDEALRMYCGVGGGDNTMLWIGGIIGVVVIGGIALYLLSR